LSTDAAIDYPTPVEEIRWKFWLDKIF